MSEDSTEGKPRVVVIGAGGHARVVIDSLRLGGKYDIAGLLDPRRSGESVDGVSVLGGDELLAGLQSQGVRFALIGIGSVGDNGPRMRLFERVRDAGFLFANAVHPAAVIAPAARVGTGVAIMAGVVVNAGASLGDNVIINTGAVVEHDCDVGAHAQIAPGAVVCGAVRVGVGAHIGAGATIRQGIAVGDFAVVGAGSVVLQDVAPHTVAAGVPARVVTGRKEPTSA